jgi:hypothetical protein
MDLRVLGAISLHDGLSLLKGQGQGCFAGDRKLAKTANTDRTNVRRSRARLFECGYLIREDAPNRRGFVVRVIPDGLALIGGEATSHQQGASWPPAGGELTPSIGGVVTPGIENEEIQEGNHLINSPEGARRASRDARPSRSEQSSIVVRLPRRFASLKVEDQLAHFERAIGELSDPTALPPDERKVCEQYLYKIVGGQDTDSVCQRAWRLLERMTPAQ